ncbi:MAG: vitamin K epoxide reductase family protein [Fimbriimonadaceae bacterium]
MKGFTQSQFAFFQGIPIAYFGLAAYIFLAALAAFRFKTTGDRWRTTSLIGLILSLIGAVGSIMLQIISFNLLKAKCDWCLASAGIMVLLVVAHGMVGAKSPEEPLPTQKFIPLMGALFVLALGGIGIVGSGMSKVETKVYTDVEDTSMYPDASKMLGPENAGITVIQIADFNCPGCRARDRFL